MTPNERADELLRWLRARRESLGRTEWLDGPVKHLMKEHIEATISEERERCEKLVIAILDRHDIWHGAPQACVSIIRELVPKAIRGS
jgi:hypothetical protein